jgi:phosphoribosyl 1,2-cyclic phosphodiesterase
VRYGGNTASVVVETDDADAPLLLDLGTGICRLPLPTGRPFFATVLVTHLHFDHVQGLPFFPPVLDGNARLDVYGPSQDDGSLEHAFARLVGAPYFPVELGQLASDLRFFEVSTDVFEVARAKITTRPVPHLGPTVGYRIDCDDASVAYVSDHQAVEPSAPVPDPVLELCDGVDLLIHDAQYTTEEFVEKANWGHSTVDFAVRVATEAGARRLCLFHHDPAHDDATIDGLANHASVLSRASGGPDVLPAAEGLVLKVG